MNFCFMANFESFRLSVRDPGHMLKWLENELDELESLGGVAIITQHVPYSNDCAPALGKRLLSILDRYQTVIRANFASHIHINNYEVLRDTLTKKPIGT